MYDWQQQAQWQMQQLLQYYDSHVQAEWGEISQQYNTNAQHLREEYLRGYAASNPQATTELEELARQYDLRLQQGLDQLAQQHALISQQNRQLLSNQALYLTPQEMAQLSVGPNGAYNAPYNFFVQFLRQHGLTDQQKLELIQQYTITDMPHEQTELEPVDTARGDAGAVPWRMPDGGTVGGAVQQDSAATLEESLAKLRRLVGLSRVKKEIETLTHLVGVQEMRRKHGMKVPETSLHLVFLGNPGTGKTTVARHLADIFRSLGLLSNGHLVEVDRAGLVAGYIGQTALKTQEVVEKAMGGILFVDEAYQLASADQDPSDFGHEAVATLVKAMEDYREDLAVIVAGYTGPMLSFIKSNPGLRSRFTYYIHFEDYSPSEMLKIFQLFCEGGSYRISAEGADYAYALFERLPGILGQDFGNARNVRTAFEIAVRNHADRMAATSNPDAEDLSTLEAADIPGEQQFLQLMEQSVQR